MLILNLMELVRNDDSRLPPESFAHMLLLLLWSAMLAHQALVAEKLLTDP